MISYRCCYKAETPTTTRQTTPERKIERMKKNKIKTYFWNQSQFVEKQKFPCAVENDSPQSPTGGIQHTMHSLIIDSIEMCVGLLVICGLISET